jgi:hypothetical protein
MTIEKQVEYQVQAEIPLAFMRYLETRIDERVLEVVLVYNGVDRFDTVIEPEGMRTDPNIVTVDYNHKGVNTGAYLRNVRVASNYKLDDGTVLEQALVGNIHIPKDSEMFFMDKEGQKRSNGNLFEAVTKGQVRSVSVEFRPYQGKQITDTKTGITTFREWDLIRLSLLDVTPGQPYSGIKITRSLINNQNNMQDENLATENVAKTIDLEAVRSAVEAGTVTLEELTTLTQDRDISVELNEKPSGDQPPAEGDVPPADKNEDGEISDEEMRSYIKNIKRAFGDNPNMVNEKVAELERMYGELKQRMDETTNKPAEPTEDQLDEAEAQRIRALNLSNIPEKKSEQAGDGQRSLGEADGKEGVEEDVKAKEQEIALKNYRKHKGFNKL